MFFFGMTMLSAAATTILIMSFMVPSIHTIPHKLRLRKSCGKELNARIFYICSKRGGFATFGDEVTTPSRRHKRGIVEECCRAPCSDSFLVSYCKDNYVEPDVTSEETDSSSLTVEHHHHRKSEPVLNMYFLKSLQVPPTTKKIEFGTVAPEFQKTAFITKI